MPTTWSGCEAKLICVLATPVNWRFEQTPVASLADAAQSPFRYAD